MKRYDIAFEFVEFIPRELEEGKLYISTTYATAAHLCCCGCGLKVATQLAPFEWSLTFDGETVSLSPSIGNWSFPCQSHYWIRRNRIDWAGSFTPDQIAEVRQERVGAETTPTVPSPQPSPRQSLWARIRSWFR
jgi:hypothetical protein